MYVKSGMQAAVFMAGVLAVFSASTDISCASESGRTVSSQKVYTRGKGNEMDEKVVKTDEEWRKILTEAQYRILRKKGTERAYSGVFNDFKEKGVFVCAGCGNELYSSETKFDSGTGWPSFWAPVAEDNVRLVPDKSLFMTRTEVLCGRCGGHLGHVFDDGPPPTGLRHCINSLALEFVAAESSK